MLRGGDVSLAPNDFVIADEVMGSADKPAGIDGGRQRHLSVLLPVGPAGHQLLLLISPEVWNIHHAAAAAGAVIQDRLITLISVDNI